MPPTLRQLRDLYYEGERATLHYIEGLLEELAEQEQILGHRQQKIIDIQHERNVRQAEQLARVKQKLAHKECEVYALTRRVGELQAELERMRRAVQSTAASAGEAQVPRDSHNSGRPPSADSPGAKATNAALRRTRSLRRRTGRRAGGQVGHQGATLHQVASPDRLRIHAPRTCRSCAASLEQCAVVGRHRRQVFDLPPAALEVTEHWAETKRCDRCGVRTKARFPKDVAAPVQYGARVRAVATYLHKYQLLPFARTSEAMRDLFGCRVSPGTVEAARHQASAKLVGVEEQIKQGLRAAAVIGADETGLRVASRNAYVHVARTDLLTHFAYDTRRGKLAMDAIGILPTFTGVCIRDGWFSYDEYRQATHALCNVHLLRELVYIEECCSEQQQWTRPLSKLLLDIKAEVERAKAQGAAELSAERQTALTARYDRLVRRASRPEPGAAAGRVKRYRRAPQSGGGGGEVPSAGLAAHPSPGGEARASSALYDGLPGGLRQ